MGNETRPLRQLSRWDKLRVRFGRCPTCGGSLSDLQQHGIDSWYYQPGGIGRSSGRHGFGSRDGIMTGHNVSLHKRKIPYCPTCGHVFHHGWIYPASANPTGS